ncbi:MAG: PqqD family peptide modification chaperone [Deltaproteobacteria bacterium]|nr:MAG: PqqD family peptide modification chaperone [Deltaproteobacteria bacterium]
MILPKRNPEVVWRLEKGIHAMAWDKARKEEDFEDVGVLTLMVKGGIHQLNLVGAEIWTRINGINTVGKISAEVSALFGWEPEETEEAVLEFLKGIEEKGWVTLAPAPGRAPAPGGKA